MASTALKNSAKHAAAAASNVLLALCSAPSPEAAQVVRVRFVFSMCTHVLPVVLRFSLIVELHSFPAMRCFETSFF
jgi:hypothetical protein